MSDDLYAGFAGKTCPIDPMRRTTCQKCGKPTHENSDLNMGRMAWCDTCRWLLRDPDTGARYSNIPPSAPTMIRLGIAIEIQGELVIGFERRQEFEPIPNEANAELWPELTAEVPAGPAPDGVYERLFRRRA